jgi:hypothetical protein
MFNDFIELFAAAANDELLWLKGLIDAVQRCHRLRPEEDNIWPYLTPSERAGVDRIRNAIQARVLANRQQAEKASCASSPS